MKRWLVVLVLLVACSGGGGPDKGAAVAQCHALVKAKLKSPATASFDADTPASVGSDTSSDAPNPGGLDITGSVDSQNGFGATVRSNYICVARVTSGKLTVADGDVAIF